MGQMSVACNLKQFVSECEDIFGRADTEEEGVFNRCEVAAVTERRIMSVTKFHGNPRRRRKGLL